MAKLPEMTAYYNQAMKITLSVPVGWNGKVLAPSAFRIFSPPEPHHNNYRATLSVEQLDLSEDAEGGAEYGSAALEELIEQSRADLAEELGGFQSAREERYTSATGQPAYAHWFSWQDPDTGLAHAQIQALLLTEAGQLYIFNAATLQPLAGQNLPIFEHILRSARIQG